MQMMPLPTNQGEQNTCAHWAVAQAISQGIAMRYGKILDVDQVALVMEQHVPAWRDGISVDQLCSKWNEVCNDKWLTTAGDRTERFHVQLESPLVIEDMTEAHKQLERVHGIRLLVCAVKWGARGSHAVVADMPYFDEGGQPGMRAVNSHGYQSRPFVEINDKLCNMHGQFQFAVMFKPTIIGWEVLGNQTRRVIPNELPSYKAKEAAAVMVEEGMEEEEEQEQEPNVDHVTDSEGFQLHLSRKSSTGYTGVFLRGARFQAKYWDKVNSTEVCIGSYGTPVEAAVAYAKKVAAL